MATQSVRIGWRPYVNVVTQVVNAVDADAQAFISAAGITNLTQAAAINTLVNDLKTYGLWTKMKAIYPFVGGSTNSHKFNLKDPRDLNAAYRLLFYGGWTHSVTGAKPNGTTGYAETYLNNNILGLNDISFGVYFGEDNAISYDKILASCPIGAYNGGWGSGIYTGNNTSATNYFVNNSNVALSVNSGSSKGMYIVSKTSASSFVHTRGSFYNPISFSPQVLRNATFKIGRAGDWAGDYNLQEQRFTYIGNGLDQTEISNLYIAVQKFQTTLGRHVGTPYVSDADAIAFLTAAGITDSTQAAAINTLVIRMKADGVWTKMKAIYPFVGGTAASHKWNLKDPRDLDAAYRLVFNGGWTHTSTGALPNGTTGWADTKLAPSSVLTINSTHFSFYSRTNNAQNGADMGTGLIAPVMAMRIKYSDNNGYFDAYSYPTGRIAVNMGSINSTSLFIHSRTSTSVAKVYRSGIQIGGGSVPQGSDFLPSGNVFISSTNDSGAKHFSNRETAFASIGDGLTDAEATALYNAVQAYQTTLGRQTDIPLVSDTDAQAFLNAANITSFQQASAVNKLVVDLKAAGVWTKMKAIYPFVGGSAASHKWNLKDPRDLDAAFRLVFNNGNAHDSNGYSTNGSNSYADTKLKPSVSLALNSASFGVYSTRERVGWDRVVMGTTVGTGWILFYIRSSGNTTANVIHSDWSGGSGVPSSSAKGFFQISRINTTQITSSINNNTYVNSGNATAMSTGNLYINAVNGLDIGQYADNINYAYAYIGDGLTSSELLTHNTIVQTYQTSLGRVVNTPIYNNGLVLNLDAGNANSYPGTGTTWFDLAAGNNGTLVNGPTYDVNNGGSLWFDGANDYGNFGNIQSLNSLTSGVTVGAWIKSSTTTTYSAILQKWYQAGVQGGFQLYISPGGILSLAIGDYISSYGGCNSTVSVITGSWVYVTATYDMNSMKIYINGVLNSTNSFVRSVVNSNNATLYVGQDDYGGRFFRGYISSATVHNRALSATEILSNFNSTRGRFGL